MNHQKKYNNIINRALSENRKRGNGVYYERHHIKPKGLGGSNDKSNLVMLTAKEHFVAHHLLAKIHGGNMWQAFFLMCNNTKIHFKERTYVITPSLYEEARKNVSKVFSKKRTGATPWNKGKNNPYSIETRRQMSLSSAKNDNSVYIFLNQKTDVIFEGTKFDFRVEYNYSHEAVTRLISGARKTLDKKTWVMASGL